MLVTLRFAPFTVGAFRLPVLFHLAFVGLLLSAAPGTFCLVLASFFAVVQRLAVVAAGCLTDERTRPESFVPDVAM